MLYLEVLIINRVLEIQQLEHPKSQRAFELSIGKTSGYLNMMKKTSGIPSGAVLCKIIEVYPAYNAYWLLTGKGEKRDFVPSLSQ